MESSELPVLEVKGPQTCLRNREASQFHQLIKRESSDAHEVLVQRSSIFGIESLIFTISSRLIPYIFRHTLSAMTDRYENMGSKMSKNTSKRRWLAMTTCLFQTLAKLLTNLVYCTTHNMNRYIFLQYYATQKLNSHQELQTSLKYSSFKNRQNTVFALQV